MNEAKVQPPETRVHEVYLPESTEFDGYIGFYVYLSEERMFVRVGSLTLPNSRGPNES
jgi:hypothetical protein